MFSAEFWGTGFAAISLKYEMFIIADNKIADLSTEFSVKDITLTDSIKGHYSLANQLERSVINVVTNIRETKYAHEKAILIAKLQIALKECYETLYCIELLYEIGFMDE